MKKILLIALLISFIVLVGCSKEKEDEKVLDSHGCVISDSEKWCEITQKCIPESEECKKEDLSTTPSESELKACSSDTDCVPKPGCHPKECINSMYESEYESPQVCTKIFMPDAAYNAKDCLCVNSVCVNKNLNNDMIKEEIIEKADTTKPISSLRCVDSRIEAVITNIFNEEKIVGDTLQLVVNGKVVRDAGCSKTKLSKGESTYCSDLTGEFNTESGDNIVILNTYGEKTIEHVMC